MDDSLIRQVLYQPELSPWMLVIVLGVAFLLGVLHALGPGHGKSLMAAYLVGSRGRIRDAVILALTITVSHVFSVILIGLLAVVLMDFFWSEKASLWISLVSGLVVMGIGIWLLVRRIIIFRTPRSGTSGIKKIYTSENEQGILLRTNPVHSYNQDSSAGHSHHHYDSRISFWSNISLGISSGIVPCPKALVILFLAISLQKAVLGVIIVSVFSLGLALVLVILGILLVKASHLLKGRFEDRRIQIIPVIGAVIIIGLGIAMTVRTLQLL